MSEEDYVRFSEWFGANVFAVNLYRIAEQEIAPDRSGCWKAHAVFQWECLDVRESELYLDAIGCLDAPA